MTSSTDRLSEERILDLVRTEFERSTVLEAAHRLSNIVDFDMVIALDAGRLSESGHPHETLSGGKGQGHIVLECGETSNLSEVSCSPLTTHRLLIFQGTHLAETTERTCETLVHQWYTI